MGARVVLTDSDVLVRVLDDRTAVVVYVQVVRCRKHCDHRGELLRRRLSVHHVSEIAA